MTVLALMYHQTPVSDPNYILDVPMPKFREQVLDLRAAGLTFIPFSAASDPASYDGQTRIAITFDDGHRDNEAAINFLYEEGIPSTSFFVRDYVCETTNQFMDPDTVRALSSRCEIGAHGATHSDLSKMSDANLADELASSRAYLEDLVGQRVNTMSVPGGRINARVVRTAVATGYDAIGDSENFANLAARPRLHRLTMTHSQTSADLLALVSARPEYWKRQKARQIIIHAVENVVGRKLLPSLKKVFSEP